MIGRSIGHYKVTERIGAGGMGEVYRARDSRLERDVALKVLPEVFAGDQERLVRFEREARLLASLKHSNIATIHGVEQDGANRVLVMELVEGEDLAQRIARGPLPADEALAIARQIADALEAAHEQGIIHRDLKPANVVVTHDGEVKVLDFGLARSLEGDASSPDLSKSPTLLGSSPTAAGVILGTAAYMSPEQARGKRVDRRADIFAFGCVLYEMLTGRQAFSGETVSDTLAAVLRAEPDWSALPTATPRAVRRLLERCMDKDPRQRLRDIGEARIMLDPARAGEPEPGADGPSASRRPPVAVWALGVLLVICAGGWFLTARRAPDVQDRAVQASILIPAETPMSLWGAHPGPPAISPDGRFIAFAILEPSGPRLAIRELANDQIRTLSGTDGAGYPFWSPDSRQVGFFAEGKLKRVEVTGGVPVTLCDAAVGKGGSWGSDGTILFAPSYNTAIFRIPAAGGTPEAITRLDSTLAETSHRFPRFLPDEEHFLYVVRRFGSGGEGGHTLRVSTVDGKEARDLFATESDAAYANGYLFFVREGNLVAQPFDTGKFVVHGDPIQIATGVHMLSGAAHSVFDVSPSGVAVYRRGEDTSARMLYLLDNTTAGAEVTPLGDLTMYDTPIRLSPDGRSILTGIFNNIGGTADLWMIDTARATRTRLTFDPGHENNGCWSPDGSRIAFSTATGALIKKIEGDPTETPAGPASQGLLVAGWSPDGRFLMCHQVSEGQNRLRTISLAGDAPDPLAGQVLPSSIGSTGVYQISFSPDGKWMAYESSEGGRDEISAVPFGHPGRRWQITVNGGTSPRWAGRYVYYLKGRELWRIPVDARESGLAIGDEEEVYGERAIDTFDVTRDGTRIVLMCNDASSERTTLSLITNWPALLPATR